MDSIKKDIKAWRLSTPPLLCLCLSLVTLPQTTCAPSTPKPTQNITVTVPEGTQSHGNPNLLCTPTRWTDVAIFFLANYVAHAATTKSLPGEPALATLRVLVLALCLPLSGVLRGCRAIGQRAAFSQTPLESAARARALCIVVRTIGWVPQRGDVACINNFRFFKSLDTQPSNIREGIRQTPEIRITKESMHFFPSNGIFTSKGRKVHGICCLPRGYALAMLPSSASFIEVPKDKHDDMKKRKLFPWCQRLHDSLKRPRPRVDGRIATEEGIELREPSSQADDPSNPEIRRANDLSSNYNLPRGLIATFQTLYASSTLYRTRGDQIQRYGFAAFGLTVAPYLLMSIIDLLGTMLTPDYPCVYLVRSGTMDEASRRKGAKFDGMVATLVSEPVMVAKHVEFSIGGDDRIFVRDLREPMSQPGVHDANNSTAIEVSRPDRQPQPQEANIWIKCFTRKSDKVRHPIVYISEGLGASKPDLRFPSVGVNEFCGTVIMGWVPLAINGGLSHFRTGHSTVAQRVWLMAWLAFGFYAGFYVDILCPLISEDTLKLLFPVFSIFFVPAIGGFVVVAQMLMSYGRCIEIGEANI